MRIAIDVMGGDHAPDAILAGALDAVDLLQSGDQIVLVGDGPVIREGLSVRKLDNDPRVEVVETTQIVEMAEPPVQALRNKPDSSLVRMAELGSKKAGDKRCDVVISAGNTGACVAAAQMAMRRLPGVHRPGVAVPLPTFFGPIVLCDVGANPEPRPTHLHQYAHMAGVYARRVLGVKEPRVALMSIGGEEGKGNALTRETHKLMKADSSLNYVGYIEGRELFANKADVVATEGFTGNVVIKLAEGLSAGLFKTIAREIFEIDPQLAAKFDPVVKRIYAKHDYHEFGGAPLLGANGVCMICHGSSEARTITSSVKAAINYMKHEVNEGIIEALSDQPAAEVSA
ncbi:MAG: phosphate acyltransferase PlsX [Phycisphaerales bacterium]